MVDIIQNVEATEAKKVASRLASCIFFVLVDLTATLDRKNID